MFEKKGSGWQIASSAYEVHYLESFLFNQIWNPVVLRTYVQISNLHRGTFNNCRKYKEGQIFSFRLTACIVLIEI